MWLQFDWGDGPRVGGRKTQLFCAWLAWSRFRVVIPAWDQTLGTLIACLDATLRAVGGAPTYLLTDNAKTVTVEHVAGIAVRHPEVVAPGRHYGATVTSCEPFDPESKGGVEATVRIAKADLVPAEANLRRPTAASPSWWRRARRGASTSTPGCTGRPVPRRPTGSRSSGRSARAAGRAARGGAG